MAGGFLDLDGCFDVTGGFGGASTAGERETAVFFHIEPLFTTLDQGASASVSMADSTSVSLALPRSLRLPIAFGLRALLFFFVASSASKTASLSHQLGVEDSVGASILHGRLLWYVRLLGCGGLRLRCIAALRFLWKRGRCRGGRLWLLGR